MSSLSGYRRRICQEQGIPRPTMKQRRKFRFFLTEKRGAAPGAGAKVLSEGRDVTKVKRTSFGKRPQRKWKKKA